MKKMMTHGVVLAAALAVQAGFFEQNLQAEISVPAIFGDHMVLQAEQPIPVWGQAEPGEAITVRLGDTEVQGTADAQGQWRVTLPARSVAVDQTLMIRGSSTLEFNDVLVGEVWIGSGQSNMAFPVSQAHISALDLASATNSRIRLFTVERTVAILPETTVKGQWQICTPEAVSNFSAVAYFFGRKLEQDLGKPVGMINSSWGGTRIEPWTPYESLHTIPDFEAQIQALDETRGGFSSKLQAYNRQMSEAKALRAQALALEADETLCADYRQADYNDRDWSDIEVQGVNWEKTKLPDLDGVVWYRRTVDIPEAWAGHDLEMHLGPVDEADVTWFNGIKVGSMGSLHAKEFQYWDVPRVYTVPGAAVKAGRNTITVRVIDTGYAGGIWGATPEDMKLLPAGTKDDRGVELAGTWKYRVHLRFITEPQLPMNNQTPTVLFNAMIHPMVPYAIRGVLWYQGEANLLDGELYTHKMQALIEGWRTAWGQGEFPFYYVQLAPFIYGTNTAALPILWDAQRRALSIPNTGMAVTTDLGNLRDIHPRRKIEVGERLARWALAKTYGQTNMIYTGPWVKTVTREDNKLRITFDGVGSGLTGREGNALSWFDIAGTDGLFRMAKATIEGETVVVWNSEEETPERVRYGFATDAEPELFNKEGLPASPFEAAIDAP